MLFHSTYSPIYSYADGSLWPSFLSMHSEIHSEMKVQPEENKAVSKIRTNNELKGIHPKKLHE